MSIIRAPRPDSGYLTISNDVTRDPNLTLRALGLLVRILSRPDNWTTDAVRLSKECKEGRDAISTALGQLRSAGYMRQEKRQDPETGRWATDTYVYDLPVAAVPDQGSLVPATADSHEPTPPLVSPDTASQGSDNQGSGNQGSGSQGLLRSTEKKEQEDPQMDLLGEPVQAPQSGDRRARAAALFLEFWADYPNKVDKIDARKQWDRLVLREGVDPVDIIAGCRTYARLMKRAKTERRFIKGPARWLNAGCWTDEVDEPEQQTDRRDLPQAFTEDLPEPEAPPAW